MRSRRATEPSPTSPASTGCRGQPRTKPLVAAATRWLPEPEPTTRLGIDETRLRSVRWIFDGITWKRSDPWLTSFVDCSADGPGSLLGLAPGRTGACVKDWLSEQTDTFRNKVEIVNVRNRWRGDMKDWVFERMLTTIRFR